MELLRTATPQRWALALGARRLWLVLGLATGMALLMLLVWRSDPLSLFVRLWGASLGAMLAFGLFEQWPARLPAWLARWALQVLAVAVAFPLVLTLFWWLSTPAGEPAFWEVSERLGGFLLLAITGLLLAPWVALSALVRQKEALARHQALAFQLERSQLEQKALDARLRLLQAQVEPHFLFNTLANVRALVEAGSPQAPRVLDSLIAYLRAAVPRLQQPATTMDEEVQLVRAYLQLMQMRMPDRLSFAITVDPAALALDCPPMTLLTLVENAVRHGIDPSEEGGRIRVDVAVRDGRCVATVSDTGAGLHEGGDGLGTGLATLRERLALAFKGEAQLRVLALAPQGVSAEIQFPARTTPP